MSWSYDYHTLGTSTDSERLNYVRLLIGDTDSTDPQVQNEEVSLALSQNGDNVYTAGAWLAGIIASKYSRRVTTELDGALMAEYSDLAKQYRQLSQQLRDDAKKYDGKSLGVIGGGISVTTIDTVRNDTDRPESAFRMDRFRFPNTDV